MFPTGWDFLLGWVGAKVSFLEGECCVNFLEEMIFATVIYNVTYIYIYMYYMKIIYIIYLFPLIN